MVTRTTLLAAATVLLFTWQLPAQDRFLVGATAGLSSTSFSGDVPDDGSYTSLMGFSAGVVGEYSLTPDIRLSVQPSYARRGTGVAFDVGEHDPRDSLELSLDYCSIPVMARFLTPGGSWFVNGGLDLGFLLAASARDVNAGRTADVKDFINSVDLMMLIGAGVAFPLDPAVLSFELRYSQSLINAGSDEQLQAAAGIPPRFRSSGFQLLAAVLFPL